MSKKLFLISASLLISIFLCLLPFFISQDVSNKITIASSLISSFASLITLLIALILFNRFGIETNILQKQTEAIIAIIQQIKRTEIIMKDETHLVAFRPNWIYSEGYKMLQEMNILKSRLLFGLSYWKEMQELSDCMKNIFIPKSITQKYRPLEIYLLTANKSSAPRGKILFVSSPKYKEDDEQYGEVGGSENITLEQYSKLWFDLINECQAWLNKNSSLKIDVNLD